MTYKNVNVTLPVDLWRKVGMASSSMGKTRKEWVAEVLQKATEKALENINQGGANLKRYQAILLTITALAVYIGIGYLF